MSFSHTPAFSITVSDIVTDESTGRSFEVAQDTGAQDPRTWVSDEHVALYAFNLPRGGADSTVPENIAVQAFAHFYRTLDAAASLDATRRWLKIFHPERRIHVEVQTVCGYSQSDWADVVCAAEEGYGTAGAHIDQYRMWAFGDVWIVTPQEDGQALSGIYADDAEEAVKQFLEQNPELKEPLPEETGEESQPEHLAPCFEYEGVARWRTTDGTVVADGRTERTSVFLCRDAEKYQRRIEDPTALAQALIAAAAYRPASA